MGGACRMKEATKDRAEILGEYILDTGAAVRDAVNGADKMQI